VLWNAQINKVDPSRHKDSIWRWVWKWKGPKRIKAFLWIAAQNGLLTNEARVRRHFTENPIAITFAWGNREHDADFPVATSVWNSLVKVWYRQTLLENNINYILGPHLIV
jgi:hypothetical protein